MLLAKEVLKICSKLTGEHPCRGAISIKLLCKFIEIALWHGCSPVNLLHIFRTLFLKNTSWWLLLNDCYWHCLDVLTYLEWLRDVELVVLKFDFAISTKSCTWKVIAFIPMIWLNQKFCFFQKSKYLPKSGFSLFVDVNDLP